MWQWGDIGIGMRSSARQKNSKLEPRRVQFKVFLGRFVLCQILMHNVLRLSAFRIVCVYQESNNWETYVNPSIHNEAVSDVQYIIVD